MSFTPHAIAASLCLLACSDSTSPSLPESVFGAYSASKFETSFSGESVDLLDQGGSWTLTLFSDSTYEGTTTIPGNTNGDALTTAASGRFTVFGTSILFFDEVSSLITVLDWQFHGERLVGEGNIAGLLFKIELDRADL